MKMMMMMEMAKNKTAQDLINNSFATHHHLPSSSSSIWDAESIIGLILYSFFMMFGGSGNLVMMVFLVRKAVRVATAMNTLLLHLCLADTLVLFTIIPSELFWRLHVWWSLGDISCKAVQYVRAYGLYLSSSIHICINLNRYYAVVKPHILLNSRRKINLLIGASWLGAALCSVPQWLIFHVKPNPVDPKNTQCLSDAFGEAGEITNGIFTIVFLYVLPLISIIFSYGRICHKILKDGQKVIAAEETECQRCQQKRSPVIIYPISMMSARDRARTPTTTMAIYIVVVFLICWTPYFMVSVWDLSNRDSLNLIIPPFFQDLMFPMVVANSAVNPYIYGYLVHRKDQGLQQHQQQVASNKEGSRTSNNNYN